LIDEYQKEWKCVIYGERNMVDNEGFHYKYVPKDAIIIDDSKKGRKKSKANGETHAYMYVKKTNTASA
jgi:hypothetical protein